MVLKLQRVFLKSDNGRNYRDLIKGGHKIIEIFVNCCVIIYCISLEYLWILDRVSTVVHFIEPYLFLDEGGIAAFFFYTMYEKAEALKSSVILLRICAIVLFLFTLLALWGGVHYPAPK